MVKLSWSLGEALMNADITIIGAGVIGLAIASELADNGLRVYVLEKNRSHGMGVSSRNSEVIHAGIYYPQNSLKAQLCLEGRELLYETCAINSIPFKKTGKLIIAQTADDMTGLEHLMRNAENNGVKVSLIDQNQVKAMEPNIKAYGALFSPETGIFYPVSKRLIEIILPKIDRNYWPGEKISSS